LFIKNEVEGKYSSSRCTIIQEEIVGKKNIGDRRLSLLKKMRADDGKFFLLKVYIKRENDKMA